MERCRLTCWIFQTSAPARAAAVTKPARSAVPAIARRIEPGRHHPGLQDARDRVVGQAGVAHPLPAFPQRPEDRALGDRRRRQPGAQMGQRRDPPAFRHRDHGALGRPGRSWSGGW